MTDQAARDRADSQAARDRAYSNVDAVANALAYPTRWAEQARAFRDAAAAREALAADVAYGAHPRLRMDVFSPTAAPRGLVVFVHGGYWLKFDRSYWSHLAAGALERGWRVAIPSYRLAPDARLTEIAEDVARAIETAAAQTAGPIRLSGHSAGGHLVARMIASGSPLAPAARERIARVVSISGLHDLRPLTALSMNAELRIDAAEAAAESPALSAPIAGAETVCWVGGDELPAFLEQSLALATAWAPAAWRVVEPGKHHFDVVDALAEARSPLCEALLEEGCAE